MKRCYLLITSIALLCAQAALAQTFSVKGVLRDPLGRTVADGAYKLTLKLYTQAEGGTEVWSEVHGSVQAENGVVSLELGTINSLSGVGFSNTYWLGITVGNFPEMEPRIKLGTNPYSLAVKGEDNLFPSTGNVGINTLAPTQPLEVNGNAKVTGALIFGDGSSMSSADLGGTASSLANPSTALITADSDQDGSGEIQFLTGTSTDLVITNAGNVGIGTATPNSRLSFGTSLSNRLFGLYDDPNSWYGFGSDAFLMRLQVPSSARFGFFSGDATEVMTILGNGNMGIGTATPANKLSVAGNADVSGLRVGGGAAPNGVALSVGGTGAIQFDAPGAPGGRLHIDGASGNVGIGTATPANKLSVAGNANVTGKMGVRTSAVSVDLALGDDDSGLQSPGDGRLAVYTNNVERMRFDEFGRVGIGTGTPDASLFIAGGGGGNLLHVSAGGNGKTYFDSPGVVGGAMTIDATNRRVGIGTATPDAPLTVWGSTPISVTNYGYVIPDINVPTGFIQGTLAKNISIHASNDVLAANFYANSDARIKNIIGTSDGSEDLENLQKLEVADYTYVDVVERGTVAHKKLIAQQVQKVYPRAVSEGVGFVPSVYQMSATTELANGLLRISTEKEHGFAAADTVRLVFGEGYEECVVREVVDAHTFAVEHPEAVEQVFVWGKKVHDFLSVDYEAVAMLNVSATQELARRVEKLEREKAALQAELSRYQALESENALLKVRMERFEAVLQRLEAQQADPQRAEGKVVEDRGLSMAD